MTFDRHERGQPGLGVRIGAGLGSFAAVGLFLVWLQGSPALAPPAPLPPAATVSPAALPSTPNLDAEATAAASPVTTLEDMQAQLLKMQMEMAHVRIDPAAFAERRAPVAERLGGAVVTCDLSAWFPAGTIRAALLDDQSSVFARSPKASLIEGQLILLVPITAGSARLQVEGIGEGVVSWAASAVGEIAPCASFEFEHGYGWVSGIAVDGAGSPIGRGSVIGCGGRAHLDDDGGFYLQGTPGPCELYVEFGADVARSAGAPVEVVVVADQVTEGVRLVAPERPAVQRPTAADIKRDYAELCAYWGASRTWGVAEAEQRLADAETDLQRTKFQARLVDARASLAETRAKYCQ